MNFFVFKTTIFDTAPDADLRVFPIVETHTAIAESTEEAQRQIVEKLYDPELMGTCAVHERKDDSPARFNIVFDEMLMRPVEWDEEIEQWIWADEDRNPQIATFKKETQNA